MCLSSMPVRYRQQTDIASNIILELDTGQLLASHFGCFLNSCRVPKNMNPSNSILSSLCSGFKSNLKREQKVDYALKRL
jgi:hypothetical protein